MSKDKYRNDFTKFVTFTWQNFYAGPPILREAFGFLRVKGKGLWGFTVQIMKKPEEITELTLENVDQFFEPSSEPYIVYDFPVYKFVEMTNLSFERRLRIDNYEHTIQHQESWDEVAYILSNFKNMNITLDKANELAEKVEAHWDIFKLIESKEIFKYFVPREMAVVPKAFIDVKDDKFKHMIFDNGHQEIIRIRYANNLIA